MVSEYIKHEQAEEVNTNKTTFHLGSRVRPGLGILTKEWPGVVEMVSECIEHEQAAIAIGYT